MSQEIQKMTPYPENLDIRTPDESQNFYDISFLRGSIYDFQRGAPTVQLPGS